MASVISDRSSGLGTSAVPNGDNLTIALKTPCAAATTANITLSGTQTIDGVAVVANDRVLVKDQTDATENGIYLVASGAWARTNDAADAGDLVTGTEVRVTGGTANQGRWQITNTGTITIGTTEQTWIPSDNLFDLGPNADTTTAKTLSITDQGRAVTMDNASANVLTIPANADVPFDIGTAVLVIQKGAGTTTVTAASGVTLNGVSAGSGAIGARFAGVLLIKVDTNTWIATGNIATVT